MLLSTADFVIVVAYVVALVLVSAAMRRRASAGLDHYLLADRRAPWWVLGVSGVMDFWDLAGSIVIVSFLYQLGPAGLFIEFRGGAVLLLAVVMLWTGKWRRRSGCMTGAEWMRFRFGDRFAGRLAQSARALGGLFLFVGLVAYATKALGVFLSSLVPLTPAEAAFWIVSLVATYSVVSGFYGLIAIQGLQFVCVLVSSLALVFLAAVAAPPFHELQRSAAGLTGNPAWGAAFPGARVTLSPAYDAYEPLLFLASLYLVRNVLFGLGAGDDPKCFAARRDIDCTKLSLLWVSLMALRWPTMMAFALLAITIAHEDQQSGVDYRSAAVAVRDQFPTEDWDTAVARITAEPEAQPIRLRQSLTEALGPGWPRRLSNATQDGRLELERLVPMVLERGVPPGLRGLVLVSLLAAATAGLSGWLNQAAGLFANDIYLVWFRPRASTLEQIAATWAVVIAIAGAGYLLAFSSTSVNDIWSWLTMGLGSGMIFAQMLPLYWRRFNGVGFAAGLLGGVAAAAIQRVALPHLPESLAVLKQDWALLLMVSLVGFVASIAGALLSPATDGSVLARYYLKTLPFGVWRTERDLLSEEHRLRLRSFHKRDVGSLPLALTYQVCLFLAPMCAVIGDWTTATVGAAIAGASLAGLWCMNLRSLGREADLVAEIGSAHRATLWGVPKP